MALNERVEFNLAQQIDTVRKLQEEVQEMTSAGNKMEPEIAMLRKNWKTDGSGPTIDKLETFLQTDFKEFLKLFQETTDSLNRVYELSADMNRVQ